MKIKDFVKLSGGFITSSGVSFVVNELIQEILPEDEKAWNRFLTHIGSWAIGTIASAHTVKYIEELVDDISEIVDEVRESKNILDAEYEEEEI